MSTEKEKKEALEKIEKLKEKALKLISEAEEIATEAGVTFSWDLAYGMGGWFRPKREAGKNEDGELTSDEDYADSDEGGWESSSSNC